MAATLDLMNKKFFALGIILLGLCLADTLLRESHSSGFSMLGWSLGLLLVVLSLPGSSLLSSFEDQEAISVAQNDPQGEKKTKSPFLD
jgi:hypothetical protein